MATSLSPDPPPALPGPRVGELATGEQLLLWALRRRLEGAAQLPALRRGFRLADRGTHARDAFEAFEQLFGAIRRNCRRDLWFHRCCGCVSQDELTILGLVAAEQSGDRASALLFGRALVTPAALTEALEAARRLALALAERGLGLPQRQRDAPAQVDGSRHLHQADWRAGLVLSACWPGVSAPGRARAIARLKRITGIRPTATIASAAVEASARRSSAAKR